MTDSNQVYSFTLTGSNNTIISSGTSENSQITTPIYLSSEEATIFFKDLLNDISNNSNNLLLNNEGVSINKFISNFNKFLQLVNDNPSELSNIAAKALELQVFPTLTDSNIQQAVNEWIDNSGTAKEKYGSIQYWDTSKVTNMSDLFRDRENFNDDISRWNTSNVTNMSHMFHSAKLFNQPLNTWDVSNVTNMSYMFLNADNFNQDLYNWNVSNVTNMEALFESMEQFNKNISNWDTSKVTNMSRMFKYNNVFNQDISAWNVTNVTDMRWMFENATAFNQNISSWDISSVINISPVETSMTGMFNGAISFNQNWIAQPNIGLWREKLDQLEPTTSFYTNGEQYKDDAAAIDPNAYPKINP